MKNQYSNFEWQIPSIVASFPKGKDAEKLFKAYQKEAKNFSDNAQLNVLKYDKYSKEIYNLNVFSAGLLNKLISESNLRVAVPGDDFNGDICRLAKDRYCINFNALVCQKKSKDYTKEEYEEWGLWKKVINLARENKSDLKLPFMIQGFYIAPDETEKEYGVKIIPAPNFKIIEDERLSKKYHEWKFDSIDKKGIPLNLDKNKGSRMVHMGGGLLSGVYLSMGGDLYSNDEGFGGFNDESNRVVFLNDAEGVAPKILYKQTLKKKDI